jgi:hypothetical protein
MEILGLERLLLTLILPNDVNGPLFCEQIQMGRPKPLSRKDPNLSAVETRDSLILDATVLHVPFQSLTHGPGTTGQWPGRKSVDPTLKSHNSLIL